MLQKSLRIGLWIGGVVFIAIALLAGSLYYDHRSRCNGKQYERAEALLDATSFLQSLSHDFLLGDPLPSLKEEQYDSPHETWTFTFRNATCTVDIITDRCQGTEVGGMSEGCTKHRAR
jgi:hypothetical protein